MMGENTAGFFYCTYIQHNLINKLIMIQTKINADGGLLY